MIKEKMQMNQDDISALAEAITNLNPPNAVLSMGAVKLPEFWAEDPELWFIRIESQFNMKRIENDELKFDHVVTALSNETAAEVKSILLNPPDGGKYETLKRALIAAFGRSQAQKDAELLALSGLGDKKPSALLRKIRSLNSDPETLRRALFLAQLPVDVRAVLAGQDITDLDELAKSADRIVEARFSNAQSGLTVNSCNEPSVAVVGKFFKKNKFERKPESNICYFHTKFGLRAKRCNPGCHFESLPLANQEVNKSENEQAGH